MNTKLIIASAAIAFSMGSASTIANSSPLGICAVGTTCYAQKGYMALGRVKPGPKALGRVNLPPVALGKVPLPPVDLPPLVIGQPAPAPMPQPSSPNIDPNIYLGGGYDNSYDDGISCGEGRSIVRHSGFRKVRAIDCSSDVFTYSAKKHNQLFKVYVNADGNIVHVSNLYY